MVSTPTDERDRQHMAKHDPYRQMEGAITRPKDILSSAESESSKEQSAQDHINSQTKKTPKKQRSLSDELSKKLNSAEQNQSSSHSFTNSVRGLNRKQQSNKKRGFFRKAGPITIIATLLFVGGLFFYGSQSLLAPHLSNLYTQQTDLQFTSYSMRNSRLMSYMLDGGNQIKISNFTKKYTTFTPYMKSRLAKNGIEVGYLDADGVFKTDQLIANHSTVLRYEGNIIDANSFQDTYASNANFRDAYYNAKRGRIAGFFDDVSDKFYQDKGATRDIFDRYKSTGDQDTDRANFEDIVSDRVTGTDASVNTLRHTTNEDTGEDYIEENGSDITTKNASGDTPEAKARSFVNGIAGKVSTIGVPVCSALRIANLASVAVGAYQIYQSMAYFLSLMEPISKMMAGEGDAAAINENLNFLTAQTNQEVSYVDTNGQQVTKTVTGSPLESAGAKLIMGNTASPESESIPYAVNNITNAATRIAVGTGLTTTVCSGVMAASAIVSLASNAVPGGTLATFVIGAVAQTIGGVVMTGAVALVINAIMPYVVKMFASNIFETYTGIPAGNLFSEGAANANFKLAQQGSAYMPASEEYIKDQNRKTVIAIAEEAELDRLNRSPFDITSDNTFLGSVLAKFSYTAYTTNVTSHLSNFATAVGNSWRSIMPGASAADLEFNYTAKYQACDGESSATCEMYGTPIPANDFSTVDIKPDDYTYQSVLAPNLDENGNIIDGSELSKFVNFCVNRESPWFVTDANILNALQTDAGIVLNNVPILNDFIDIINAYEDASNQGWATGTNCMMSADNPRWDSEFKYYQLYIQDMRYLSTMEGYNAGGSTGGGSLTAGGLSLSEAQALMQLYKDLPSPQISDPWDISANDFPHGCGASLANCVEFSLYFVNRYTKAHLSGLPDGHQVVGALLSSGQGFIDGGNTPKPYAIFSHNSGSFGGAGHTGVVLGIDTANNKIIIGEAGCGSGLDFIGAHEYSLSEWTNNPSITYAYTDNILVPNGKQTAVKITNPILAYEAAYEAEHPKDYSFEGTLARISGMTRDDIAFLLEVSNYTNFLAQYDPSTRYAFYEKLPEQEFKIEENTTAPNYYAVINENPVFFTDKRNYAVWKSA